MIPIQLWRARIGLFNVKCCSAGPRAFRLEKLTIPSTAHSPKGDSSPIPSTIKHVPASSDREHKCAFSAENSSSDESTTVFVSIQQQQSADRKDSSARTLGSKAVYSLLSSLNTDGMLYLPSDLLRDAVVMLLIAIVSQLLILSGDIETNPGPIGEYHCDMCVSNICKQDWKQFLHSWFLSCTLGRVNKIFCLWSPYWSIFGNQCTMFFCNKN